MVGGGHAGVGQERRRASRIPVGALRERRAARSEYARARFTIWAAENGYLDAVRAAVEAAGRTFDKEIHDLYVSPVIAKALLDADPTLGARPRTCVSTAQDAVPADDRTSPTTRCSTPWTTSSDSSRPTDGKLPLTLVVLDEMQQYIGDDNDKALAVQNIVEGCSAPVREPGAVRRDRPERPDATKAWPSSRCLIRVRNSVKVLEPDFRAVFHDKNRGMGMGLAIVRTIIEAHGGQIRAENQASGGAIFSVTLPVIAMSTEHFG